MTFRFPKRTHVRVHFTQIGDSSQNFISLKLGFRRWKNISRCQISSYPKMSGCLRYIGDEILPGYVRDYNKSIGKSYDFYHLFRLKSWGKTSTNQPTNPGTLRQTSRRCCPDLPEALDKGPELGRQRCYGFFGGRLLLTVDGNQKSGWTNSPVESCW